MRRVHPSRLTVDQTARVEIVFENTSTRRSPVLLAEERMHYVLGDRPRFVLPRMEPGERREVTYAVRLARPRAPPARAARAAAARPVRAGDRRDRAARGHRASPCCRAWNRSAADTARGDGVGAEGAIPHMVALHGEDDVAIRELPRRRRPAPDPLARDRAPSELMVRQEDRPARRRAVVVLDSRASGHRGRGASGSFEWAVTAVASIIAHLDDAELCGAPGQRRDRRSTVGPARPSTWTPPWTPWRWPRPPPRRAPSRCCTRPTRSPSAGGLVIAVATDHDEDTLRRIASLRQPGGTGLLLLVEAATFAGPAPPSSDSRAESLAGLVAAAGWSTVVVRAGTGVGAVWSALTASSGVTVGVRR